MCPEITMELIRKYVTCSGKLARYEESCSNFKGSIVEFLNKDDLSYSYRLTIALRILPEDILETFAMDCMCAYLEYFDNRLKDEAFIDVSELHPNLVATIAATQATHMSHSSPDKFYIMERERQLSALLYLIEEFEGVI